MVQKLERKHKIELAKKLDYILFKKKITKTEIAHKLGYADGAIIGRWCNQKDLNSNIIFMAQEALEKHFDIPLKVWDKGLAYDIQKIDSLLDNHTKELKNKNSYKLFKKNDKLITKLKGQWYAYMHPSNPDSAVKSDGVWIVKTTITEDYHVIDEWDNEGTLLIGKNQSLILKESYDEGDLTVIRFPNRQVTYKNFRFVIISNQNGTENEMINFGFYSREKYSPKIAKEILGSIDKVQLKLDLEFNDRITKQVRI